MIKRFGILVVVFLIILWAGICSGLEVKYSFFENAILKKVLESDKTINKEEVQVTIKNFNDVKAKLAKKNYRKLDIKTNKKTNLIGSFPVYLTAFDKSNNIDKFYLLVKVRINKNVVKAKNLIKRGAVIASNDLVEETDNFLDLPRNVVKDKDSIIGKEAKFDIVPGRLVLNYMVREVPLVKSKEGVVIIAKSDDFEVMVEGVAMQDGSLGEEIKVKNLTSDKNIMARVIGKNKVAVNFE